MVLAPALRVSMAYSGLARAAGGTIESGRAAATIGGTGRTPDRSLTLARPPDRPPSRLTHRICAGSAFTTDAADQRRCRTEDAGTRCACPLHEWTVVSTEAHLTYRRRDGASADSAGLGLELTCSIRRSRSAPGLIRFPGAERRHKCPAPSLTETPIEVASAGRSSLISRHSAGSQAEGESDPRALRSVGRRRSVAALPGRR